ARALEGIDRLLLVADGEDGADRRARRGAGEEFSGQRADDLPLPRAGVLRLVDEDVVDPLVELVVDPGADVAAGQKRGGTFDQVVEIKQAAPALEILVVAYQPRRDHKRGAGRLEHAEASQTI